MASRSMILYEPVPCKGQLGLWQLPLAVENEVIKRASAAQFKRVMRR
jgi:hypothetical protein